MNFNLFSWLFPKKQSFLKSPSKPILHPMTFAQQIIYEATKFIGVREVVNNRTWDDVDTKGPDPELNKQLTAQMKAAGWEPTWAYCIAWAESVWVVAGNAVHLPFEVLVKFAKLTTPGVLQTFNNWNKLGLVKSNPVPGAIWLARHGSSANGHAGIVLKVFTDGTMETMEGNTNTAGGREGDGFDDKKRNQKQNGQLKTLGFIHPDVIKSL